jgi:phosphohistidine swiveling domain-containing protein
MKHDRIVILLDGITDCDCSLVGAKAVGLARPKCLDLPVNVGEATKIIKTGQEIEVDGNRGVVRILK